MISAVRLFAVSCKGDFNMKCCFKRLSVLAYIFCACFVFGLIFANNNNNEQKRFVIVTASYNNHEWVAKNLNSIFSQTYKNFRVIYYDDASTDDTADLAYNIAKKNKMLDKIRIVKNQQRVGAHENIYRAIHSCDDDEIAVIVDGDDWLAHNGVLFYLNEIYMHSNTWITYGQYRQYPSGKLGYSQKIPDNVIKENSIRKYSWVTSHLRTFYAWLYKRIKTEDLIYEGRFLRRAGDLAIMLPMIEMAGEHSLFTPEILLIYNTANDLSFGKPRGNKFVSQQKYKKIEDYIRSREVYAPITLSDTEAVRLCR